MAYVMRSGLWFVLAGAVLAQSCQKLTPSPETHEQLRRGNGSREETQSRVGALLPAAATSGLAITAAPGASVSPPSAPEPAKPPVGQLPVPLELRRLVVSSEIKDKEPVLDAEFKSSGPVYAFLELVNPAQTAGTVQVVFQHESGQEVGFVQLPVPADKSRWRTWAHTQMVKQPGKWTAIVRGSSGTELGQQGFFVR